MSIIFQFQFKHSFMHELEFFFVQSSTTKFIFVPLLLIKTKILGWNYSCLVLLHAKCVNFSFQYAFFQKHVVAATTSWRAFVQHMLLFVESRKKLCCATVFLLLPCIEEINVCVFWILLWIFVENLFSGEQWATIFF